MTYKVELKINNNDKESIIDIKVTKNSTNPDQTVQPTPSLLPTIDVPFENQLTQALHEVRSQESVSLNINISDIDEADLDVERIRKILDKYINITAVKIISQKPDNENANKSAQENRDNQLPKEEKQVSPPIERIEPEKNVAPIQVAKSQQLQNCANEIIARNKLINILGVDTRGDSFDPWLDLMAAYLNDPFCSLDHADTTTLSYYGNRTIGNVEINDIRLALDQMGKRGFQAFVQAIYLSTKSQNSPRFRSKLIFTIPPKIFATPKKANEQRLLNFCNILEILIEAQRKYQISFPFDNLLVVADLSDEEVINQQLMKLLIEFATINPHVNYIENALGVDPKKQKVEILNEFLSKVKENRLTSTFNLPVPVEIKNELDDIILGNRRWFAKQKDNLSNKENIVNSDFFEPVGVPSAWLHPRSDYNSQEKITVQYEHTISRTTQHSISTDTFAARSMQRMQQIQNQQQRQQQLINEGNKKVDLSQLSQVVDRNTVKTLEYAIPDGLKFALQENNECPKYLTDTWDSIVGTKIKAVDKISVAAMKIILFYPEAFSGGIISHNLPEGFYIGEYNNEKILCYEKVTNKKQNKTKLTAPLRDALNEFITQGTAAQFKDQVVLDKHLRELDEAYNAFIYNKRSNISRKDALLKILNLISPENETKLKENYAIVLNTFTDANFRALRIILTEHGPIKLIAFFNKLKLLQEKGLYDSFKLAFLDTSVNWNDLVSAESFAAIDRLYQLDINQANWWVEITKQQAESQQSLINKRSNDKDRSTKDQKPSIKANVVDMVTAFNDFYTEIKKLDPTIELPNPCRITSIKNAHVVLERLLYILKNSADPKEQLYNLEGVSLDHEAAYYAVRNDGYNFVCSEMELTVDKIKEIPNQKPSYKITKEELCGAVARTETVEKFKTLFFRYLGLQRFTYPFAVYRKIFNQLINAPFFKNNQISIEAKNCLLAIIAIATTDERSLQYDPQPLIEQILSHLSRFENDNRIIVILRINNLCRQGLKPDVHELLGITKFLVNSEIADVVPLTIHYEDLFKEYGPSLTKTLANCGHREDVFELSVLLKVLNNLLEKNTITTDKELMKKFVAILGSIHLIAGHVDELLSRIAAFLPKQIEKLNNLLDVLGDINVTDAHSADLPDITIFNPEFIAVSNKSAIRQLILNNYPSVNFSQQSLAVYSEDCKSELIALLRDDQVKNYLPQLNLNGEQLIHDLCSQKREITVDVLLDTLNSNINRIFLIGGVLKDIVIKKFISSSVNNALSLIKDLSLPEVEANQLIKNLTAYMGSINDIEDIDVFKSFIGRVTHVKKLVNILHKSKSEEINKYITKLNDELEQNKPIQNSIIERVSNIFSDNKFNLQQRARIYLQLLDVNSANALHSKIIYIVDQLGIDNFNFVMNVLEKCPDDLTKMGQCVSIERLIALIKNNCKDVKQSTIYELARPLLEKFAAHPDGLKSILHELDLKQAQIIQELFWIINVLLINSKENNLALLANQLSSLIDKILFFDKAKNQNGNSIVMLAALFKRRPYPTLDSILASVSNIDNNLEVICNKADINPWGNRDSSTQLKFDDAEKKHIQDQIYGIKDLVRNDELLNDELKQLYLNFQITNNTGKIIVHYNRIKLLNNFNAIKERLCRLLVELKKLHELKDLTADDKIELAETLKQLNEEIFENRAILLAYLREIYYRTSISVGNPPDGKFPDATQTIAVLHSIQTGSNVLLGIDTGQGKATSTALQNAMLWCEGHTVDSCSNNMDNAARDKNEHEDFYRYIGAEVAVIDDNTAVGKITDKGYEGPYKEHAVHYTTRTKLGLYRDKCALEGIDFRKIFKSPISLNYDEFDSAALDDTSQTILSEGSSSADPFNNPDKWIYPLVNRFVDFIDKKPLDDTEKQYIQACFREIKDKYTIAEEVFALREYLYKRAEHENKPRLTDKLIHLQLNTWIKAAKQARELFDNNSGDQKDKDFCIETDQRVVDGQTIRFSKAVIMEGGFPNVEARWQNGVHQLLHARLNEKRQVNDPEFICEQQRKVQASATSKNFFDYYLKNATPGSRIIGNTATPGSEDIEIPELSEDYQLQVNKMPPHQKSIRKTLDPIHARNLDEQVQKLADLFRKETSARQLRANGIHGPAPILICCADIPAAEAVAQRLRDQNLSRYQIKVLTGKMTQEERNALINNAGQPVAVNRITKGRITISTISGIGTDIKTLHPQGLLTCGTHVTTYRKEKQQDGRSGRRGQPGRVIHSYNDEAMQRDFGVTLSDKFPEEIQEIMKKIQDGLDLNNQKNRRKINRAGDISRLVQEQLNQCYQFLLNSAKPNLEDLKKEFTKIRQYIVEDLSKTWDEMFSDMVANHPMMPEERLNYITEDYIKFVNKLWIRKSHELLQLGIPQELLNFKVEDHFAKSKPQKTDYAIQKPVDDKYVKYFKAQINKPKDKIVSLVQFFRDTTNSKLANKQGTTHVLSYQQAHSTDMLTNAIEYVETNLREYLTHWGLGDDRRECVDVLLNDENIKIANQNNFVGLIAQLNMASNSSFAIDCLKNQSWNPFSHRSSSRFRDKVIFKSKMYVYSVCPPAQLENVAKQDLLDLRQYLDHNLNSNPYYNVQSDIKNLLSNVVNNLPTDINSIANTTEKLAKAITGLRRIINSADYKDKVSGLLEITVALDYLYKRLNSVAELKDNQYQQAYKSVQRTLTKIDIKEPSYFSSIFSNPYDIPDNINFFQDVLGTHAVRKIANARERFHLYQVMTQVQERLATKYGAHNIEFKYDNAQLKVNFKLTDTKTLATSINEILIHIDMKRKTFIPEPVVTTAVAAQPESRHVRFQS